MKQAQDFETIALGLKPPLAKATLGTNDHIILSFAEAAVVARLPNSSEYNTILRIMEGELEKLETEHMRSWLDKEKFDRTGIGAALCRIFYERIQQEINFHSGEFMGNQASAELEQEVESMSPEDFMRKSFGVE
jgi:hypothetical protein